MNYKCIKPVNPKCLGYCLLPLGCVLFTAYILTSRDLFDYTYSLNNFSVQKLVRPFYNNDFIMLLNLNYLKKSCSCFSIR